MLGKIRGEYLQNTSIERCGWLQKLSLPFISKLMSNNAAAGCRCLTISSRFTSIFIALYYCFTPVNKNKSC